MIESLIAKQELETHMYSIYLCRGTEPVGAKDDYLTVMVRSKKEDKEIHQPRHLLYILSQKF